MARSTRVYLIVVNWLGDAAIAVLLIAMPTSHWIESEQSERDRPAVAGKRSAGR